VNGQGNREGNRDSKGTGRDARDRKRPPAGGGGGGSKPNSRAPEQTFEEVRYLKHLIDNHIRVRVRLLNNEEVSGTVEYYDQSFIRLTREPEPNLFIFKHEIKYLYEE
jgi:sRNA-binding regulator protein Hfq